MTKYRFIISLICFGIFIIGYSQKFDARLAKKLGADEYGMKSYVLVILKTAPTPQPTNKPLIHFSAVTWTIFSDCRLREN